MEKRVIAALLGVAALAVPAAAAGDPGHGAGHGHGPSAPTVKAKHQQDVKTKHQQDVRTKHRRDVKAKRAKNVMFVFKGPFTGPGTVAVVSGNAQARNGGFVGQSVSFDLSSVEVVAADTNGDSAVDMADVKDGDRVLIQARLSKRTKFAASAGSMTLQPIVARKLIDKTSAPPSAEDPTA